MPDRCGLCSKVRALRLFFTAEGGEETENRPFYGAIMGFSLGPLRPLGVKVFY